MHMNLSKLKKWVAQSTDYIDTWLGGEADY